MVLLNVCFDYYFQFFYFGYFSLEAMYSWCWHSYHKSFARESTIQAYSCYELTCSQFLTVSLQCYFYFSATANFTGLTSSEISFWIESTLKSSSFAPCNFQHQSFSATIFKNHFAFLRITACIPRSSSTLGCFNFACWTSSRVLNWFEQGSS